MKITQYPHDLFLKEFLRGWQRSRHRSAKNLSSQFGGTKPRRRVTEKPVAFYRFAHRILLQRIS